MDAVGGNPAIRQASLDAVIKDADLIAQALLVQRTSDTPSVDAGTRQAAPLGGSARRRDVVWPHSLPFRYRPQEIQTRIRQWPGRAICREGLFCGGYSLGSRNFQIVVFQRGGGALREIEPLEEHPKRGTQNGTDTQILEPTRLPHTLEVAQMRSGCTWNVRQAKCRIPSPPRKVQCVRRHRDVHGHPAVSAGGTACSSSFRRLRHVRQ